jgi:class 3 adenylate cyclase/tetratricopeptide (TPR) repeat protein
MSGAAAQSTGNGERRHLTVLFCDLVGSTAIAARLDPEEWRETVAGYHRLATEAITRFEGHVAKYLGDGVMAYFGWPAAHDNDAERAARAGLALLDAIAKLNQQPGHANLSARVGIDSGLVVIGKGAGHEAEVFGDVPNIAARVQAIAEAGTVAITDATHRLVAGLFVVENRGAQQLKGLERPLQLYRVVRPSGMRGRFPAMAAMRGMTPFVGREDELRSLLNRWERVCEGEGQVVTIFGEGGIGKSRLVQRFREEIAATPYTWLESATAPFFQNTPFYAVADMMQQSFHWEAGHTVDQRLAGLEASLGLAGLDPDEAVPLIAPLLELPVGTRYPPLALAPDQQRKRLLATIVAWTFGAAKAQPLVIATEDLHWADPSTLELTQLLVEQGAHARLLLLYTARPEFHAPWPMRAHHTQINLNRLTARNVRTMVAQVAAKIALSDETVATVVARTGGVPLFVEELTRAVLESGEVKLTGREIPATLHDSLTARLDRLGPVKEVIQVGAVIGSEFSYELLYAVHPIPDEDLQDAIHSATDAELVYVRGIPPDATYQFKHALIRDAAYEALLRSRRKEPHSQIAKVLRVQFSERITSAPELLAHHYTEAGLIDQAIPCWQIAGQRAIERSANMEAISHLTKGLELVELLSDEAERIQQELTVQTILGPAFIAAKGYAAPEVERTFSRARELCNRVGDTVQLFSALYGLGWFHVVAAKLETARGQADELLEFAEKQGDPVLLLTAHRALGYTLYDLGEFASACVQFAKGMAIYNTQLHSQAVRYGGTDPGVGCLCFSAMALWYRGYPDQALERMNEALRLAQELSHPISLSACLNFAARVAQFRGEPSMARARAEASILSSAEQGFTYWLAEATILKGWTLAEAGQGAEGLTQMREGLAACAATGARAMAPILSCADG